MKYKRLENLCPGDVLERIYPLYERCMIREIFGKPEMFHFCGFIVPARAMREMFKHHGEGFEVSKT